ERIGLPLPVRVNGRHSVDHEWTEMSHLVDVTPFGARLRLKRPTEVGRLLLLTLAMPRKLRCFDHIEDQYRVWSLVRNVRFLDANKQLGAAVFTSLDLSPGRFVKLSSEQHGASVLAVVRVCRAAADGIPRLHLEFVGSEWPL